MPIIVTKEIAAFLAGRMEVELDWGDVYTFEQRLSMFTVFIQACQIGGVDPQYGIKQFLDRSKDLVEPQPRGKEDTK